LPSGWHPLPIFPVQMACGCNFLKKGKDYAQASVHISY